METFAREEALLPSEARKEKWRRVGNAHLSLGEFGEALRAFVSGDDPQHLVPLLRDHGDRLSELGFGADVASALAMLPSERRRSERALLLLEADAEIERGRKEIAEHLLRLASASGGDVGRIAAVRLATELVNRGRPGAVDVLAPIALRHPDDPQVQSAFAVALAAAGDRVKLAGAVEACVRSVRCCSDPLVAARAWQRLGLAAHFAGAREEARLHCAAALEIVVREGFDGGEARVRSLLYSIAVAEDDDAAIVAEATKMVAASRRAGLCQLEIAGLTALLVHAAEIGDDEQYAVVDRAFSGLGPVRGYADAFPYAFARAVGESRRGRLASAAAGLDRIVCGAEEPTEILACADALATLLADARDPGKGKARLAGLRKRSRRHAIDPRAATSHTIVLLSVVTAILEARYGQRAAAARNARQATRAAASNRERALATAAHDLAWAEEPREWRRALDGLRESGLAGYADLFALLGPAKRAAPDAISSLEREILRLYAERRQAKEVADILGRNVETVRTHIRNGMKKLGVKGREALIDHIAASDEFGPRTTEREVSHRTGQEPTV
jgi:DNA-binding CsgD family transcriptional regulator